MKTIVFSTALACMVMTMQARQTAPRQATQKCQPFSMTQVHLLPSRFLENMKRDSAWMMAIPVGRLLHSFRNTSGAFSSKEGGYMTMQKLGGWESLDCDLRGHTTGHLFKPSEQSKHLTGYDGENCCTFNLLKLADHLFFWNPNSKIADYYERALYNHILGQQDPATGMVCYFTPLQTGAYRLYSTRDKSFWCCVGSGFESHVKYASSIYFHSEKDLYVNLFIPSKVDVSFGMQLREEATKDDASKVALFYGPVVMAGKLDAVEHPFSDPSKYNDYYTYDFQIPASAVEKAKYERRKEVELIPFYDAHHCRYVVYWQK